MKIRVKSKVGLKPIGWITLLERGPRMDDSKNFEVWSGLRKRVMKQLTDDRTLGEVITIKIEDSEKERMQAIASNLFTLLGRSNFEQNPDVALSGAPAALQAASQISSDDAEEIDWS